MPLQPSPSILKVTGQEVPKLNWNDDQAVQYQIAINCLHNHVVGILQETYEDAVEFRGRKQPRTLLVRKGKCLKFADQMET